MNKEELMEDEETSEITLEANDAIDEMASSLSTLETTGNDLRIEETVTRSWSGVSSCGDKSRIDREVQAAYEGWVKDKLFQYRHLQYITYGHGAGKVKTSSSRGPWPDRKRSCRGSLSMPCYIVFKQP